MQEQHIFSRENGSGNWDQVQKLVASDRDVEDRFGVSSINGNYAIIGAYWEDHDASGTNPLNNAGSAYIFERDGNGNWSQVQKIVASDRGEEDLFGWRVSINGNYVIVAAPSEDEDVLGGNTIEDTGTAYIFERNGNGIWNEVQKIVASDRSIYDFFGRGGVSIYDNYAIIGTWLDGEDASGGNSMQWAGSAYIFERDGNGNWNQVQKIVASDRKITSKFGSSVSISGNFAIVGATGIDTDASGGNKIRGAGAVYIFERDGNGTWIQKEKIVASDRGQDDSFGHSVSISGQSTLIGANLDDEDASGGNYIQSAGSAYLVDTSPPLSISESVFGNNFRVYPNPTTGAFNLELGQIHQEVTVTLTTLTCQIISTKTFTSTDKIEMKIERPGGDVFCQNPNLKRKINHNKDCQRIIF